MDVITNCQRRLIRCAVCVLVVFALPGLHSVANAEPAWAIPTGYPEDYRDILAGARREGSVNILGSTDRLSAEPLVKAFEATYPGIKVTYADVNTSELDARYRKEAATGPVSDIVWSSAMDLQVQLLRDGLGQEYASPETRRIPSWAEYRRLAYAATYEPVVFAYNRAKLADASVPQTHAELLKLLESKKLPRGAVQALSVAASSLALLLDAQDRLAAPDHPRLLNSLGDSGVKFAVNNAAILKALASGEATFGFNVLGSYVDVFARKNPSVAYVIPRDYALVISRVMLIAKQAPHPNAARLWLDFVLSQRGQTVMANESSLGSVRDDVNGPFTLRRMRQGSNLTLRPIGVSNRLLDHVDPAPRAAYIERWQTEIGAPRN